MGPLQENMMIEIKVPDMTCCHCARTITDAVKAVDPAARLEISIAEHLVRVDGKATKDEILLAISEAGFNPG